MPSGRVHGRGKAQAAFLGEWPTWGDHHPCLFSGTEWFFRTGYRAHLAAEWLPALDGVTDRLREGASVADVGCGHGASMVPRWRRRFLRRPSRASISTAVIETARARVSEAGVAVGRRSRWHRHRLRRGAGPSSAPTTARSTGAIPAFAARHARAHLPMTASCSSSNRAMDDRRRPSPRIRWRLMKRPPWRSVCRTDGTDVGRSRCPGRRGQAAPSVRGGWLLQFPTGSRDTHEPDPGGKALDTGGNVTHVTCRRG